VISFTAKQNFCKLLFHIKALEVKSTSIFVGSNDAIAPE